jgi:hypothetical protein
MTEEEFLKICTSRTELYCDSDDELQFKYDYGFNPLKCLANRIMWSHPDSLRERQVSRFKNFERLRSRKSHAKFQIQCSNDLKSLVKSLQSGLMWGPIFSPVSAFSVMLALQVLKSGLLVLEVSEVSDFALITKKFVQNIFIDQNEPTKIILNDLEPSTHYYARCFVDTTNCKADHNDAESREANREEFNKDLSLSIDQEVKSYAYGQFWTLNQSENDKAENLNDSNVLQLSNDESDTKDVVIFACGPCFQNRVNRQSSVMNSNILVDADRIFRDADVDVANDVVISCILGDIFSARPYNLIFPEHDGIAEESIIYDIEKQFYNRRLWEIYCASPSFSISTSLLRQTPVVIAWNDNRSGSDRFLRKEEIAYKQYTQEIRKFRKKVEVLQQEANRRGSVRRQSIAVGAFSALPSEPILIRPTATPSFDAFAKVTFLITFLILSYLILSYLNFSRDFPLMRGTRRQGIHTTRIS